MCLLGVPEWKKGKTKKDVVIEGDEKGVKFELEL